MYNTDSYILMVGINYSYKNLHTIIEAYENLKDSLSYDIVIVGNYNVSYGKQLIDLTKKFSLEERVKFLGYIEDDVKHSLYQASKAFIYPSLYEGFGLPVLEAMNNRTPVVCSNSSSLPEVAGEAAIYINSSDINEIKETLMKINNMSNEERQVWIKKGSERVNKFSWQKCVNSVEEVIRAVAKQE
ncbi:Mannosylfructose-phosphate synthase [compost metagenome]